MTFGAQGQFKADQAMHAIFALLTAQLPAGTDVQGITDKDFNNQGELVMNPPSVRIFFAGAKVTSTSDAQRLSYNVVDHFVVLCLDQDRTGVVEQALASLKLASLVNPVLIGARLVLTDGDISEPLTWVSIDVQPVIGEGVAYALGFEVPGLAQFPGTNANPIGGN